MKSVLPLDRAGSKGMLADDDAPMAAGARLLVEAGADFGSMCSGILSCRYCLTCNQPVDVPLSRSSMR